MATEYEFTPDGCRVMAKPDCRQCHGKGIERSAILDMKGEPEIKPCGCVIKRIRESEPKK